MTDEYREEQEMEAEALTAIFGPSFTINATTPLQKWSLTLQPHLDDEPDSVNHVAVRLDATLPPTYPEVPPLLDVGIVRGLAEEQRALLKGLAEREAEGGVGMPAIYTVAEAVREWLVENNVEGMEDESMYAQMMRRAREEEKAQAKTKQEYESQTKAEQFTEAELEDLDVRKRRAEGTPCTSENFEIWKATFDAEMEADEATKKEEADDELHNTGGGGKKKKGAASKKKVGPDGRSKKEEEAMEGRLTGFDYFNQKVGGVLNLEALEAAADEAAAIGVEEGEFDGEGVNINDLDEGLFDDEDDLDDLDFDSDDEDSEDDDDDDEEVDI